MNGPADDSLSLRLEMPARAAAGEPVPITIRARNATDEPLRLYLTGRPIAFDITVTRADGTVVWRRLEGRSVPTILQIRTLGPGESLELHEQWDQRTNDGDPAGPGTYTVRGALLTDAPEPLETPARRVRVGGGDR